MKISLSGRAQTSNCLLSSFQIRLSCGQAGLTALFMIEKNHHKFDYASGSFSSGVINNGLKPSACQTRKSTEQSSHISNTGFSCGVNKKLNDPDCSRLSHLLANRMEERK
jgi:hypothetical protein